MRLLLVDTYSGAPQLCVALCEGPLALALHIIGAAACCGVLRSQLAAARALPVGRSCAQYGSTRSSLPQRQWRLWPRT